MHRHARLAYTDWIRMTPFWRLDYVRRLNKDLKEEGEGKKGVFAQLQQALGQIFKR